MTRPNVLHIACILLCAISMGSRVARAQYLFLDANGDGAHTAGDMLSPSGTTTIDVWLDTNSNRDGADAVCSTGDGDLTINSYEFILHAVNGTVSWGSFTNLQPDFTTNFGHATSATDFHGGFGGGAILPPGLYHLAAVQVSVAAGTPSLTVATSTTLSSVYLTSFGSRCSGNDLDNTLKLGTDWFDADGLPFGGVANQVPALAQPADMELAEGEVVDQTLHATDGDGQPLEFTMVSGPLYMSVTTVDPGAGVATGNLRLAPLFTHAGTSTATLAVGDGISSDTKSLQILVNNTSRFSVAEIGVVTVEAYQRLTQPIYVQDPDVGMFTFTKVSGPDFLKVIPPELSHNGQIIVEPGLWDVGASTATIAVSNGTETLTRTFTITVTPPPPCGEGFCLAEQLLPADVPIRVTGADLDGDSRLDLIATTSTAVLAHRGKGNGWFEPGVHTQITAPVQFPRIVAHVETSDLNGDGKDDVVTVDYDQMGQGPPTRIQILLSRGDGSFERGPVYDSQGAYAAATGLGDLNADGIADLANVEGNRVNVYLGHGDGTFASPVGWNAVNALNRLEIMDVNGDGVPDLTGLSREPPAIMVLAGRGDGTFDAPRSTSVPQNVNFISAGDLNSDGHGDLGLSYGTFPPGHTLMFLGGSGGTFTSSFAHHQLQGVDWGMLFADMNGDGTKDAVLNTSGVQILTTDPSSPGGITVSIGRGDGSFGDQTSFPAPVSFGYNGICTGDWNGDGRVDIAATDGPRSVVRVFLNRGYTPHANRPPEMLCRSQMTATEGSSSFLSVGIVDPDGDAITSAGVDRSGLPATITVTETNLISQFGVLQVRINPDFGTAGEYSLGVRAIAGGQEATVTIPLHVLRGNRRPVADAGGPYTGVAGAPVQFDGSGSHDPDGEALTYSWIFGDGSTGAGRAPQHTYDLYGRFPVLLTVRDSSQPPLSASASTEANIAVALRGTAFLEPERTVALIGGGSAATCVRIEPVDSSFDPGEIDPTSIVMMKGGLGAVSEISAIPGKSETLGDEDRDGIEEIGACFRREDLRQLLSFVTGKDTVGVGMHARLRNGAKVQAPLELVVLGVGGPLSAALAPNPLNPEGTLSFVSTRQGAARVDIFDVGGRLVNTLLSRGDLPAGYHELRVDGRARNGETLASGVYFYRIEAGGAVAGGRFAILK